MSTTPEVLKFKTTERYGYGWVDPLGVIGGNRVAESIMREVTKGTYVTSLTADVEALPLETLIDTWLAAFGNAIEYNEVARRFSDEPDGMLVTIATRLQRAKRLVYIGPMHEANKVEMRPAILYLKENLSANSR